MALARAWRLPALACTATGAAIAAETTAAAILLEGYVKRWVIFLLNGLDNWRLIRMTQSSPPQLSPIEPQSPAPPASTLTMGASAGCRACCLRGRGGCPDSRRLQSKTSFETAAECWRAKERVAQCHDSTAGRGQCPCRRGLQCASWGLLAAWLMLNALCKLTCGTCVHRFTRSLSLPGGRPWLRWPACLACHRGQRPLAAAGWQLTSP